MVELFHYFSFKVCILGLLVDIYPESPLEKPTEQHIPSGPIEYVQKVSLIEDNIEYPLHDIITEAYK